MVEVKEVLELLKPLAAVATPGPWYSWACEDHSIYIGPSHNHTIARLYHTPGGDKCEQNAAFMSAASPGNILELISAIERCGSEIQKLMTDLAKEKSYSKYYERKFHEVSAECAELASSHVGTVGDLM